MEDFEKISNEELKDIVNKEKSKIESYFMEDIEHQNKVIYCILINPTSKETITIAGDLFEETIMFAPYTKDYKNEYMNIPEWDFNIDEYVFKELENGYKIGFMSDDMHYGIWNVINNLYPEDIEYESGVQEYLRFCSDNNITKEYIDTKTKYDTPYIMNYYEIPNNYFNIGDKKVEMSKDLFEVNKEKNYIVFVLGYDLLNRVIKDSQYSECDLCYKSCNKLAEKFMKSDEYKDNSHSMYEMLEKWINKNIEQIKEEFGYVNKISLKNNFETKKNKSRER